MAKQMENGAGGGGGGTQRTAAKLATDDFWCHMPSHKYIYLGNGDLWPATSVNDRVPPVFVGYDKYGQPIYVSASNWIAKNQPVEAMTWHPGQPRLIVDKLMAGGGLIDKPGNTLFNLYEPPTPLAGHASKAEPWRRHVERIYPDDWEHIVCWLAQRVQHPGTKLNHALVLGGAPGIGKDSLLHPLKAAVGSQNFLEVSPVQLTGRFNAFLKSVILRVSEARDMGDLNRFQFYDHCKILIAAPPEVLLIDEKNRQEYLVVNVTGIVFTTNNKETGLYLPPDDRRHYVAWSPLTQDSFDADYFPILFDWYESGGNGHVAALLRQWPLDGFDPKAPPKKTPAFWQIVESSASAEDSAVADLFDKITNDGEKEPPAILTLDILAQHAMNHDFQSLADWLRDPKNRRIVPGKLEKIDYARVLNDSARDKLWKINGKRQVVYGYAAFPKSRHLNEIQALIDEFRQ
ncbi:primase-helicase family protein [Sinorhizobium meliloti]|uniref:primase-helicase family protein n=1 Tax=Rhizobium meliloti TaxID=382 RepID=UPI003F171229